MWDFMMEHSVSVAIIIVILFIMVLIFYIKMTTDDMDIAKQKSKNIISFLAKKTFTFAELRDGLSELTSLKYFDLFERNFKLSDIDDDTKIIITLYYSQKEIEEKLYRYLINDLGSDIGTIGSMRKI